MQCTQQRRHQSQSQASTNGAVGWLVRRGRLYALCDAVADLIVADGSRVCEVHDACQLAPCLQQATAGETHSTQQWLAKLTPGMPPACWLRAKQVCQPPATAGTSYALLSTPHHTPTHHLNGVGDQLRQHRHGVGDVNHLRQAHVAPRVWKHILHATHPAASSPQCLPSIE